MRTLKTKIYEILREGELSVDGRYILPGAIKWPESPLPVLEFPLLLDLEVEHKELPIIVGEMFNFRRDDNGRIYCDADVDGECIGVDLMSMEIDLQGIANALIVTAGEIYSGMIMPASQYVWRD